MLSLRPILTAGLLLGAMLLSQSAITQQSKETFPTNTSKAHKWWNLLHYTIDLLPDYNQKFISGSNSIRFTALQTDSILQIDLQPPMSITHVSWNNQSIAFKKEGAAYLIYFPKAIAKGQTTSITIAFEGHPPSAIKPPFDNGWIWATDTKGRPWMSVACEGSGASIWLPCKEVLYDEPDQGVEFNITVPDTLMAVANGRLTQTKKQANKTTTYTWTVTSPINNYNIIPAIGTYANWHSHYAGLKGQLDCDYWVLDYNLEKAKKHLKQADTMLQCFEYWLGPYPFYKDSYKVVESPMPGMEHQSAIAYGNGFENGYSGKNLSGTKWTLLWDFILIHESGHEWFGNSITASDGGHSWIHEGFTKYLETVYTDYSFGKTAGNEYALGTWKRIKNDEAIIGSGTTDKYYKGSAMLHMIRQIVGDTLFRGWLKKLNQQYYHSTVNTAQILATLNSYTKKDFTKVFDQYLRTTQVPAFEYYIKNGSLNYRWANCVTGFNMPLKISTDNQAFRLIYPTASWQKMCVTSADKLIVDSNFYIENRMIRY